MKIKVIFTGGTIGSQVKENGYISPKKDTPYELIESYQKKYSNHLEFETIEPYCILSENLTAHELNQLILCIKKILLEDFVEGIILTHGTDTLQYSAAVLSYVFGKIDIPIVLVSSDFPLEDKRANGYTNFYYAVKFIEEQYGKGVFVSYCNKGGKPTIHKGARLIHPKAFSGDVESIKNTCYGYFEQEKFISQESCSSLETMFELDEEVKLSYNSKDILRIVPSVGMEYPIIGEEVRVILHESYHSGTIGISPELKEFVKCAKERKIPIYVSGLTRKESAYETVEKYQELGMIPIFDIAPIALYCKLWLALSNKKDIKQVLKQEFTGE